MNYSDYSIDKQGELLYQDELVIGFEAAEKAKRYSIEILEYHFIRHMMHDLIQPTLVLGKNNILLHKLFDLLEQEYHYKQDIQQKLKQLQNRYSDQKYLFLAAKNKRIVFWYRTSSIDLISTLKALFKSYNYRVGHNNLHRSR